MLPIPTMTSSFGGSGGDIGGQPPVPGPIQFPIPDLPNLGGGSMGGPIDTGGGGGGGGNRKDPWDWGENWEGEEGEELMGDSEAMARGGIATRPTRVTLGEQGPEAGRKVRPGRFEVGERPMTYLRRGGR